MRKSSNDYRKELNGFRKSVESTEAHIKARLIDLVEKFPEAIVSKHEGAEIKAKSLTPPWVAGISTDIQLDYITAIEEYTESLEPVRQMTIHD